MRVISAQCGGYMAVAMLLGSPCASAHHSFAMFDRTIEVVLTGTVKEFQWGNPHSYIQLISDKDGQNWSIEGTGTNILVRQGWKPKSLSVGDKVSVHVHPLRNGAAGAELMWGQKADGSTPGKITADAGP